MKINIPKGAELILNSLNNAGFEAYVVGGCVRDSILHKNPKDWDICTSAKPEEIMRIFEGNKIIPTGLKHGTVTICFGSEMYEVTTYRIDGDYSDNRHPDSVKFTDSLKEDLSRRDFTINAMAYNPSTGLIDLFGGRRDIFLKKIRCVGNPNDRFNEDALRMMRAARFAITLGFKIEKKTQIAIMRNKYLLTNIAVERINAEFTKALKKGDSKLLFQLIQVIIPELTIQDIEKFNKKMYFCDIETKIAYLFDSQKDNLKEILKRLRFDNNTIKHIITINTVGNAIYNGELANNPIFAARKAVNMCDGWQHIATESASFALKKARVDKDEQKIAYAYNVWDKVFDTHYGCTSLKELNIDGEDLIEIGYSGSRIGNILDILLNEVMLDKLPNNNSILMERAEALY